jgi:hypothetical protein
MIKITLSKDKLDKYRQYKIDLVQGNVTEDIEYKVLEHVISSGICSLQQIYSELGDDGYEVTIDTDTCKIQARTKTHDDYLERMKKLMGAKVSAHKSKNTNKKIKTIEDLIKNKYGGDDSLDGWKITYYGE